MRKICVFDQKGGVGKTTSAVNLAAGLARNDRKILLIDMDPQGSVEVSLHYESEKDLYDMLVENARPDQCIRPLGKNLDILPASDKLIKAETVLSRKEGCQFLLANKLKRVKNYDYIIIDASPSLSLLNQNALLYVDEVVVPTSTDFLGYKALKKTIEMVRTLGSVFEHELSITKVVPTMFDRRNRTCKEFLDKIRNEHYDIVSEPIRLNSKLKEAPGHGKSIFAYDKKSNGAKDYLELVKSVINDELSIKKSVRTISTSKTEEIPTGGKKIVTAVAS